MRIGIDATGVSGRMFGIHHYVHELVFELLRQDQQNEYVVFCRGEIPERFRPFSDRAEFRVAKFGRRKTAEQLWLPFALRGAGVDLLHSPYSLPCIHPRRSVITAHDVYHRHHPELFDRRLRLYLRLTTERSWRAATRIIAISESTRRDLIELIGIPENRIDLVYNGLSHDVFRPSDDPRRLESVRRRYDLPERFVLNVGGFSPIKNVETLVRSFARISDAKDLDDVHLVLVGAHHGTHPRIAGLAHALDLTDRIHFPGYVPDEDLPALYQMSSAFAFPSLAEGFGLPVLEAMACGTPVITSNLSSLPEVAGGAACLVAPQDQAALADAMERVLGDTTTRDRLVADGLQRAAHFSWQKTASEVLAVYRAATS